MPEIPFPRLALALVLAAGSCTTPPRDAEPGPRTLADGMVPMSGQPVPSRAMIRATLFDICDRTLGNLAEAAAPLIDDPGFPSEHRIALLRTQLRVGTTVVATATTRTVESGVVDLYCYLAVCEARTRQRLGDGVPDGPEVARLLEAIRDPLEMARHLLESTASAGQVELVDAAVAAFLARDSNEGPGLLLRLDDFADLRASTDRLVASGSGIFAAVDGTRDEIRETRESAELVAYAMQRMPMLARWHVRLLAEELLAGPGTERAYRTTEVLARSVDGLAARIDLATAAADRVEATVDGTVAALGRPDGALAARLAEARAALGEATSLRESLDGTLPALDATLASARETLAALRESVAGVDALRSNLKEDGVTLDPAAARAAASDLAAAAADLKLALGEARTVLSSEDASARLEEIVKASRTATDYLFWRAGLLLLIAACLSIVLRVAWVLTGRRGKA